MDLGNCEYWVTVVVFAPNEVRTDVSKVTMPGKYDWKQYNYCKYRCKYKCKYRCKYMDYKSYMILFAMIKTEIK